MPKELPDEGERAKAGQGGGRGWEEGHRKFYYQQLTSYIRVLITNLF